MYRAAVRLPPGALRAVRQVRAHPNSRRLLSTAAAPRRGTWKGTALRWGLAIGVVYWYNTSPIFADDQAPRTVPPPPQFADSDLSTVDAVIEEKRRGQVRAAAPEGALPATAETAPAQQQLAASPILDENSIPGSPGDLEEEAGQQGAFDPETGEINWDCPCLGGMAHGPCGDDFKAAFSCFVYSKEEPKGMDCIDKFQNMQDCFRKHPDVYGAELQDEDDGEAPDAAAANGDAGNDKQPSEYTQLKTSDKSPKHETETAEKVSADTNEPRQELRTDADVGRVIPKQASDATSPGNDKSSS